MKPMGISIVKQYTKMDGSLVTTYKEKSGKVYHTLSQNIPGRGKRVIVAKCDVNGNPRLVIDHRPKQPVEVYRKADDGSTLQVIGNKIKALPHVIFNNVCEMFFK